MKAPSQRQLRVGEQIRHVLYEILQRETFHDPDLENTTMLSVNEVQLSPDLKNATAYMSSLNNDNIDTQVEALNRVSKFIKRELGSRSDLRFVPRLRFITDHASAYAQSIDHLMQDEKIRRDVALTDNDDTPSHSTDDEDNDGTQA